MKIVLNYSHPLSDKAREQISRKLGGEFSEIMIRTQIDLGSPVKPQIDRLVQETRQLIGPVAPAAIVPPSLGAVAGLVIARLSYAASDGELPTPPPVIVLRRSDELTPVFELAEIVKY